MEDGLAYVFAAYGLTLAVLVIWIWMLMRRIDATITSLRSSDAPTDGDDA